MWLNPCLRGNNSCVGNFSTSKLCFMNFQTMSKQRKYILIAAAVGIIAVFLPWVTIGAFGMSDSQNGFHSYGIVVFLAFAVAIVINILGDQTKTLDQTMWMVALAAGVVGVLFTILFYTDLNGGYGVVGSGFSLFVALKGRGGGFGLGWLFKN